MAACSAFADLNEHQLAAVMHGEAPLLVIAGAGTGKTATLAARVARLVADGVDPRRLLLLTFSRRAAQTMARRAGLRVQRALGLPRPPLLPWAGTFHAVAARLLRECAPAIELDPGFTVLDRGDSEDLMALAREGLGLAAQTHRFPLKGTCLAILSRQRNRDLTLADVLDQDFPWCSRWHDELQSLFVAYDLDKRRQRLLDFDDLLLCWAELLADDTRAAAQAARFDHVLVDEYQDTNRVQARILERLRPQGRGLTAVGDDAQSIYGFRGAEVRNILDFPTRFGADVVTLERNYRSTPQILAAANAVAAAAAEGHAKHLWSMAAAGPRPLLATVADEAAQASWVADSVLQGREQAVPLRRQAVLFRTGQHSAALELELLRRGIPFVKYGGLKFIESAHVKDLLSLLRWVQNPRHTLAGFRVALLVPGIGPAHARRLQDALRTADDAAAAIGALPVPSAAQQGWRELADAYASLAAARWPGAYDLALAWYLPQLHRMHDDAPVREADLRQLGRLAAAHPSREQFLAELTLDPPAASSDEAAEPLRDEDYLVLSTIHAAKGREWTAVHVLSVVDGCIPSDMAGAAGLAEERRLLYVAMTRARRELTLLLPQRFYVADQPRHGDRHLYAIPSRFLDDAVIACCDGNSDRRDQEASGAMSRLKA